jgi:hypothetical protein
MARAGTASRAREVDTDPKLLDWFVPLSCADRTLREACATLGAIGLKQSDIPYIVRVVENPAFDLPLVDVFHGATSLQTHDYLHVILGRGLLPKDEAFVIGFTMGSTDKVGATEEFLFGLFAKHLYPREYRFTDDDFRVFKDAVRLGFISDCRSLCEIDYADYLDLPLGEIRRALGIETSLLRAYYAIEQRRYAGAIESRRLLD